jgi:UDP-N-acetylmuramoylalanine-D-glutamate ligase
MLDGLKKKNYISVLLNIYSDHIDRHNGFENYKDAKINILNGSKYNIVRDEVIEKYELDKEDIKELAIRIF